MEQSLLRLSFILAGAYLIRSGITIWLRGEIYTHLELIILCFIFVLLGFFMLFIGTTTYRIRYVAYLIPTSILGSLSTEFYISTLELQSIKGILPFLFHLAIYLVLYVSAPSALRPISVLPLLLFSSWGISVAIMSGNQWQIGAFFLLLSALYWKKGFLRAFCYGIACSVNYFPIILGPFLLVRIWKEASPLSFKLRGRRIGEFLLIAGFSLLICSFFFLLEPSGSLFDSVQFSFDMWFLRWPQSLIFIWVQIQERFTGLALLFLPLLVIIYALHFKNLKHSLWIYPGMLLWLFSEKEENVVAYWLPMLMLSLYTLYSEHVKNKEGTV